MSKRQQPEHALQMAVCDFLNVALPEDAIYLHIPNGGDFPVSYKRKLAKMGLKAGAPDLVVFWTTVEWPDSHWEYFDRIIIWFELKAPGKAQRPSAVSDNQRGMHACLKRLGHNVYVVDTAKDVEIALRECGIPLRATLTGKRRHGRDSTEATAG